MVWQWWNFACAGIGAVCFYGIGYWHGQRRNAPPF